MTVNNTAFMMLEWIRIHGQMQQEEKKKTEEYTQRKNITGNSVMYFSNQQSLIQQNQQIYSGLY